MSKISKPHSDGFFFRRVCLGRVLVPGVVGEGGFTLAVLLSIGAPVALLRHPLGAPRWGTRRQQPGQSYESRQAKVSVIEESRLYEIRSRYV